jgi:hypothetical protein
MAAVVEVTEQHHPSPSLRPPRVCATSTAIAPPAGHTSPLQLEIQGLLLLLLRATSEVKAT